MDPVMQLANLVTVCVVCVVFGLIAYDVLARQRAEADIDLNKSYEQVEALPSGKEKAAQYIVYGLLTDGAHHKQWCLERAYEALGYDPAAMHKQLSDLGYEAEEGIAP